MTGDAAKPLPESPSQTAGPYVHLGLLPNLAGIRDVYPVDPGRAPIDAQAKGERIAIVGGVYDGAGEPVTDALLEIWQADARGVYRSPGDPREGDAYFGGWARTATDAETGEYRFDTIKPGRVPLIDGRLQAPHVTLWIVARGINVGLQTRIYFETESAANAEDALLARVPAARRETLIAEVQAGGVYRFDLRLQGERETVFLDI